jgi:phosphate transport system ATP-binding protein
MMMTPPIKIRISNLSFSYNGRQVLHHASASFAEKSITAIVGPSGCGKSTLLLTINRLWEVIPGCALQGRVEILLDGGLCDIYGKNCAPDALRRRVGIVFQMPNPLPMTIWKNVAFPLQLAGFRDKRMIRARVEEALRRAGLWEEVKDRLDQPALSLSGGQQQRMCLARALILEPEVLLLDEPTSALDQQAATAIEQVLLDLKQNCTILLVSHYLDQVKRIADRVVELRDGRITDRAVLSATPRCY